MPKLAQLAIRKIGSALYRGDRLMRSNVGPVDLNKEETVANLQQQAKFFLARIN